MIELQALSISGETLVPQPLRDRCSNFLWVIRAHETKKVSVYTEKDAEREHAEWLDELNHSTREQLLARHLDLSKRYDYLDHQHERALFWLWVLDGFALLVVCFLLRYFT